MRAKRTIILILLVAMAGALVTAPILGCDGMDGSHHALMGCPAGILPLPLALGLIALAFVTFSPSPFRNQLVLIRADPPPRLLVAR